MILTEEPGKILVCRLGSLRELVVISAILHALKKRYSKSEIHLVTREQYEPLFRSDQAIDIVYGYDPYRGFMGWRDFCHSLTEEQYDLYIDLQNNLHSRLLGKHLSGVNSVSYKSDRLKKRLLTLFHVNLFPADFSLLSDYRNTFLREGIILDDDLIPEIRLSEGYFSSKLAMINEETGGDYCLFLPIAPKRNLRWNPQNYKSLAEKIVKRTGTYVFLLAGIKDDYIQKEFEGERIRVYRNYFSLEESLYLIKGSRFIVGNDTGLMYVADAMGIPGVCILGASTRQTGSSFYSGNIDVLEQKLLCRPCSPGVRDRCRRLNRACLKKTKVEDVLQALKNKSLINA